MKSARDYLLDLLEYIGYLESFGAGGREQLETDVKTRLAVIKAYEVVGEILKRLPDDLLNQQPHIRWKEIKGFRDVLIHQYDNIRTDRVWAALEDLPNLRAAAQALLDSLPAEEERDGE
jgi:uncharacterized protein with HEPN domain